jgi:acetyl-CoA acetyltransferase
MRQSTSNLILYDYRSLNSKPGVRVADGAAQCLCNRVGYNEVAGGLSDIVLVVRVQNLKM